MPCFKTTPADTEDVVQQRSSNSHRTVVLGSSLVPLPTPTPQRHLQDTNPYPKRPKCYVSWVPGYLSGQPNREATSICKCHGVTVSWNCYETKGLHAWGFQRDAVPWWTLANLPGWEERQLVPLFWSTRKQEEGHLTSKRMWNGIKTGHRSLPWPQNKSQSCRRAFNRSITFN